MLFYLIPLSSRHLSLKLCVPWHSTPSQSHRTWQGLCMQPYSLTFEAQLKTICQVWKCSASHKLVFFRLALGFPYVQTSNFFVWSTLRSAIRVSTCTGDHKNRSSLWKTHHGLYLTSISIDRRGQVRHRPLTRGLFRIHSLSVEKVNWDFHFS